MNRRFLAALASVLFASLTVSARAEERSNSWTSVISGVYRSPARPYVYAIIDGDAAALVGASKQADIAGLAKHGVKRCELVLLTHHHRDSCQRAADFVQQKVPVRASKRSADWILPAGVSKWWQTCMPRDIPGRFPPLFERYWTHWAYLMLPTGIEGIACDLDDGQVITWRGWRIRVVDTPGHTRDHTSYIVERAEKHGDGKQAEKNDHRGNERGETRIAFCGDAFCRPGKMWTPYTLEWHHVNDDGFRAAAESLRKLAAQQPDILCPEHGPVVSSHDKIASDKKELDVATALRHTAEALTNLANLKSFERYTKETIGNPPKYAFLAPDQVGTANPDGNPKPWTKISPHLLLTGNTYAILSKDGPVLLMDPYARNIVEHVEALARDYRAKPVEAVMISHGHNDHYTGIFALPKRDSFQVWTIRQTAQVIGNPHLLRAPYVDPRVVRVDTLPGKKPITDGTTFDWHEYQLKFHHLPGQTTFAMGVEVAIDGHRCLFTGDNFYHQDQYTGSGGWSALNRGLPTGYAESAKKILAMKPDWILAEHGGAFEFHAEDFRRRVAWAEASARAADQLSLSGDHRIDWDLHRVRIEPLIVRATAGKPVKLTLVIDGQARKVEHDGAAYGVSIPLGNGLMFQMGGFGESPGEIVRHEFEFNGDAGLPAGRHAFPCEVLRNNEPDESDTFFVVEIVK